MRLIRDFVFRRELKAIEADADACNILWLTSLQENDEGSAEESSWRSKISGNFYVLQNRGELLSIGRSGSPLRDSPVPEAIRYDPRTGVAL
jgi:hypothetical protein